MTSQETPPGDGGRATEESFEDRSTALVVFGVFHLLVALFFLFGLALMTSAAFLQGALPEPDGAAAVAQPGTGGLLGVAMIYLLIAGAFGWLGVGSILGRRWARALSLVVGWYWLITGALSFVFVVILWGSIAEMIESSMASVPEASGGSPEGMTGFVLSFMLLIIGLFGILAPGALVLFYRSPDVRATCERKDPTPRWTDTRPLPILALMMLHLGPALGVFYLPASNYVTAAFGRVISGEVAFLYTGAMAVASLWCAWRLWHLDVRGWWGAVAFWVASGISSAFLFVGDTQAQLYEAMGLADDQAFTIPFSEMGPLAALSSLAFLIFLLYTKQFMKPASLDL